MSFKQPRDWNATLVSRGHDTRHLAGPTRGNSGTLVFSVARRLGDPFVQKYANGKDYVHVRVNREGDRMILYPIKPGERGRKFSLSTDKKDYRAFFDPSNYPWIGEVEPFAATEAKASLIDSGILVLMPPKDARLAHLPYTEYRPRTPPPLPKPKRVLAAFDSPPPSAELSPPAGAGEGTLYLVLVPPEKEDKFQLMMRFLKLEALKE